MHQRVAYRHSGRVPCYSALTWRPRRGAAADQHAIGPIRAQPPNRAGLFYLRRCLYRRRP